MIVVPIVTENHVRDRLLVILDPESLARMREADPAEVNLAEVSRKIGSTILQPIIHICYEEKTPEFERILQSGDVKALLKYLSRGWRFRPDQGDHDRGPEHLHERG